MLSCEAPAAPKPPGLHTTARELQTCTFQGAGVSNTTKIPRKDPQEREERKKIVAGEGKKSDILGGPEEGGSRDGRSGGRAVRGEGGPGGGRSGRRAVWEEGGPGRRAVRGGGQFPIKIMIVIIIMIFIFNCIFNYNYDYEFYYNHNHNHNNHHN